MVHSTAYAELDTFRRRNDNANRRFPVVRAIFEANFPLMWSEHSGRKLSSQHHNVYSHDCVDYFDFIMYSNDIRHQTLRSISTICGGFILFRLYAGNKIVDRRGKRRFICEYFKMFTYSNMVDLRQIHLDSAIESFAAERGLLPRHLLQELSANQQILRDL